MLVTTTHRHIDGFIHSVSILRTACNIYASPHCRVNSPNVIIAFGANSSEILWDFIRMGTVCVCVWPALGPE